MLNIQTDSRKIKPGDTFIAIPCEVNDGHQYIASAVENGATKVIVEKTGKYGVETIVVPSTRKYLNEYLKKNYNHLIEQMNLIGITGTNGKTTSAVLLHDALNLLGHKTAYIGTIGFYMKKKIKTLPNTTMDIYDLYDLLLQAYEAGCKNVVMEISSHALENGRCETLNFDYTVFTNLTQDHLDEHGTMENYAHAKQKLMKQLKPNGTAFINQDDAYRDVFTLKQNHNIFYGFKDSTYQVLEYKLSSKGTQFVYQDQEDSYKIKTRLLGRYNIYNVLVVIAILREMKFSVDLVNTVIPKLKPPVGRMDTVLYGSNSIIIDYAHTPDALENVFKTVQEFKKRNIYVVFGCTGDRDRTKRPIMTRMVGEISQYFIITNDDPHMEDPKQIVQDMIAGYQGDHYEICLDRRLAIRRAIDLLETDDILLILGKGHEEFMIIKREYIPFNDQQEVLNYLEEKRNASGH